MKYSKRMILIYAATYFIVAYYLFLGAYKFFPNLSSNVITLTINALIETVLLIIGVNFFKEELVTSFKKLKVDQVFVLSMAAWLLLLSILTGLSSLILVCLTNESSIVPTNEKIHINLSQSFPWVSSFFSILVAPLLEELVFRFALMNLFKNKWFGLMISSILFGLIHVIQSDHWIQSLPYIAMGFVFGLAYLSHKNIWAAIGVHALNNFAATLGIIIRFL